jgi:hypothetical protein
MLIRYREIQASIRKYGAESPEVTNQLWYVERHKSHKLGQTYTNQELINEVDDWFKLTNSQTGK